MSYNINKFIEQIVKKQLPDLAMKDTYLGAGIIAGGIEFLGACLDDKPIPVERESAARFCRALNELFPIPYHQFSRPHPYKEANKPVHDLYSCLRCGMAHVLRPQGILLTWSKEEAAKSGGNHLAILNRDGRDYPLIVVNQFVEDFIAAATELEKRLAAAPLPPKLQGNILTVWD